MFLLETLGMWGVGGYFVAILIIAGIKLYRKRNMFLVACRQIEMMIFKKPFDKDLWDKGEMKNTKLKFTWGKDGN